MKRPFAYRKVGLAIAISSILMTVGAVRAQQVVGVNAGTVNHIEGEVFLDDKLVQLPKGSHLQMGNGQSLSTKQGRVELLLSSYAHLRLGENSLLRMQENQLSDTRLALEQGSTLIEVVQEIKGNRISVLFSKGVVEVEKAGLYRFDSGLGELRVYGGEAIVVRGNRKITIRSGRMAHLSGGLASEKFDMNVADSLHQWAAQRSFSLFAVTPDTRKQTHWTPVSLGWVHNSNYRMSFYSEFFRLQWIKDRATQRLEELLAKYRLEEDVGKRTIYGAELQELVAKVKEAMQAIQEADEQAKQADPGALQPKPDAGHAGQKVPNIPNRYIAVSKSS